MKKWICSLLFFGVLASTPLAADECMEGNCEDGVGTGFTEEGKIYQGQWKDGRPNGAGKLFESKGIYLEGNWENGKLKEEKSN